MQIEKYLARWQQDNLIDPQTAARLLAFEKTRSRFGFGNMLIGLAGLCIFLGMAAVIGANWDAIPALVKMGGHALINGALAFALYRLSSEGKDQTPWFTLLLCLVAGLTLTFIALVGQIYQTQEPTWKALVFWMFLVSPFWLALAKTRTAIHLWIASFLTTFAFFMIDGPAFTDQTKSLVCALLPFGFISVGELTKLRKLRKDVCEEMRLTGYLAIAIFASTTQALWRTDFFGSAFDGPIIYTTTASCLVAVLFMISARGFGLLIQTHRKLDLFLLVSVLVCAAPLIIPHGHLPVLGAVIFMLYWALYGWAGVTLGYPSALTLAASLIALRLIGIYIEVFGSLLQTGVGLIFSGCLLMGLVWGTRKVITVLKVKV